MHLIYRMRAADDAGMTKHPQIVMKNLEISYSHSTSQSMFDCWIFWNCTNVPNQLPEFLEELNDDPMNFGVSDKEAKEISMYKQSIKTNQRKS